MRVLLLLLIVACGSLQAQDLRYGKVSKEEIEETAHPLEPEADAAILFRDTYVHFDYFRNQGFNIIRSQQGFRKNFLSKQQQIRMQSGHV